MNTNTRSRPNPQTIPHTSRQRVIARDGSVLERAYLFMPAASWAELQNLCYSSGKSGSQVVQQLISIAATGKQKDKENESTTRAR